MKRYIKIKTWVAGGNGVIGGVATAIAAANAHIALPMAAFYVAVNALNGALIGYGALSALDDISEGKVGESFEDYYSPELAKEEIRRQPFMGDVVDAVKNAKDKFSNA